MKLRESIDTFLNDLKEDNYYDSSVTAYRRKINVFCEFLTDRCGTNDDNYQDLLRGMANERIIKSIEYYVEQYNIKFIITVENYFTVISSYFKFVSERFNIINENFDSAQKYAILKDLVYKKISEMELDDSETKYPISQTAFDKLIEHCDSKIDEPDIDTLVKEEGYNKAYTNFISAIITKLVMFTAIKNNVISKVRVKDLDLQLNKIRINSYWIHLPDRLGLQFKKFWVIRNRIMQDKEENNALFINRKGQSIGTSYGTIFSVMEDIIGDKKAECVSKYTIMEMIKSGINPNIILSLTGFALDTYNHCQELVDEIDSYEVEINNNRYLDSKIRALETFDKL